jgi:homocysteine S-methyltransferase
MSRFAHAVAAGPVVLDGGLATHLEARGHDLSSHLWSARLVLDDPDAIVAAHRDFFDAGAEVATTASYQASFDGLARLGLDRPAATRVLTTAVRLARRARDELAEGRARDTASDQRRGGGSPARGRPTHDDRRAWDAAPDRRDGRDDRERADAPQGRSAQGDRPRWVAASVGPYGAALADGSEYRGDYGLSVRQLAEWHRPRFEVLADAGADVLAFETVPCLAEVEALLTVVDGTGVACWLSLTNDRDRTRRGEPLAEAFDMADDVDEVVAVGVNCCDPGDVGVALEVAADVTGKPLVAYPNSGEAWDAGRRRWVGTGSFDPDLVTGWLAAGAGLVGGCCRVGPTDIAALTAVIADAGARSTHPRA